MRISPQAHRRHEQNNTKINNMNRTRKIYESPATVEILVSPEGGFAASTNSVGDSTISDYEKIVETW